MSRRVKWWIAAIFLLLLTGPVVYLALAWSPENPLRFRVTDPLTAAAADPTYPQLVEIEVENTTRFPLVFFMADVGREDMRISTLGNIHLRDQQPSVLNRDAMGVELRGGQRTRLVADMSTQWHREASDHGAKVKYHWCSGAEYWLVMRLAKVVMILPDSVQRFIPSPRPSTDTTPLDPFARDEKP
ncbi:hypothetical protein DES53_103424 [Roseimicrobium gellanilyticum]|uniref:Uncharacterized protein n=1 Tax=Roseimicrobium gellanilyticum TaxID=748857 RepID=A0A366HPK6_9BACT|nr:hypothetical protein [Roseimicrobium gellanilyticum]RBP45425.1 hypothetical protein DES53_103424 [Roseimicrobium gellanilyticum]